MPEDASGLWSHPDAEIAETANPYYDRYRCPHCGIDFKVEVAD
jgi:hypothetical protein